MEKEAIFNTFYKAKHLSFGCFLFWLYTICWGLETIQKIRHVGSDFFYTGFGQPTKKGATCPLNCHTFPDRKCENQKISNFRLTSS